MSNRQEERVWLEEVGMRVRLARVRARQSQDRLAKQACISRVTMGSIERGEHPSAVTSYVRLARTLGMSLNELLDGAP